MWPMLLSPGWGEVVMEYILWVVVLKWGWIWEKNGIRNCLKVVVTTKQGVLLASCVQETRNAANPPAMSNATYSTVKNKLLGSNVSGEEVEKFCIRLRWDCSLFPYYPAFWNLWFIGPLPTPQEICVYVEDGEVANLSLKRFLLGN